MSDPVQEHCAQIELCNQRGGRMLSVVDLLEAGTLDRELAAYLLAALSGGASFMVGAVPGGAGKTTVMGALLNFAPADTRLVAADGAFLARPAPPAQAGRLCCICHEIGSGSYYCYLWGASLRRYFALTQPGHLLATNLHADTLEQAHAQICAQSGVRESLFRRMNLALFLTVDRAGLGLRRRIGEVWESDGNGEHQCIYGQGGTAGLELDKSRLVQPEAFQAACGRIDGLAAAGVRTIAEVRRFVVDGA